MRKKGSFKRESPENVTFRHNKSKLKLVPTRLAFAVTNRVSAASRIIQPPDRTALSVVRRAEIRAWKVTQSYWVRWTSTLCRVFMSETSLENVEAENGHFILSTTLRSLIQAMGIL